MVPTRLDDLPDEPPSSLLVEMLKTNIRLLLQSKGVAGRVESRPNRQGQMVIGVILTDHKLT